MKGTVVEIKRSKAAVLTGDGIVMLVPNNQYRVGQVITVKKNKLATIVAAAAAVVLCTIGAGAYAYNTPYSTVSLDVNPSLELRLNRFDRVIEVVGFNKDAEEIIASVELKNKRTEQAIETLAHAIVDSGYLAAKEGGVVVTVAATDGAKAQQLAEKLEQQVRRTLTEQLGEDAAVVIEAEAVDKTRVEEAHALGLTPGKLNLIEKLATASDQKIDEEFIEKWADASVKNIMKANKLSDVDFKHIEKEIEKLAREIDKNERKGIDNDLLEEMLDQLSDRLDDKQDEDDSDDKQPNKPDKPSKSEKPTKPSKPSKPEPSDKPSQPVDSSEPSKPNGNNTKPPKDNDDEQDEDTDWDEDDKDNGKDKDKKPKPSNPNKPVKDTPKPANPNKPVKQPK